jgi:hypothetical protein
MPATTGAPYNLPYPLSSEAPNGPAQLQSLAEATAAAITTTNAATAANSASALSAAVASIGVTTGSLQASVTALNALNIGPTLATVSSDTGWVGGGFANAAGWSATWFRYRIFMGKFVFVELMTNRTGSTITAGSSGNIGDTLVITLPVACAPNFATWGIYTARYTSGCFTINSGGQVTILDAHSGSEIDTGASLRLNCSYVRAG